MHVQYVRNATLQIIFQNEFFKFCGIIGLQTFKIFSKNSFLILQQFANNIFSRSDPKKIIKENHPGLSNKKIALVWWLQWYLYNGCIGFYFCCTIVLSMIYLEEFITTLHMIDTICIYCSLFYFSGDTCIHIINYWRYLLKL